jgi:N-acetyl-anhydromuramyl-L-alanine amidase AmpD
MNIKIKTLILSLLFATSCLAEQAPISAQKQLAQQHFNQLIQQRSTFQNFFLEAYKQNPELPQGLLESLAFTASRWQHIVPKAIYQHGNNQRPQAFGIFGLYNTDQFGFVNTLKLVADSYSVSQDELLNHLDSYIFATAHYLAQQIKQQQITSDNLADYSKVIQRLSGIAVKKNDISQFANKSFVYDVLLNANKGMVSNGIEIKAQKINWYQAFNKADLQQLKAPQMILDSTNQTIRAKTPQEVDFPKSPKPPKQSTSLDQTIIFSATTNTQNNTTNIVDYPGALWHATPNQSSRKGRTISHITIHTTQGSYASSITWLANTAAQASAHYVIRSNDGQITQMVRDADKAWHARSANVYTIGIEHEGFVDNPDWYTDALYTSSANLSIHLCENHPIDCTQGYAGSSNTTIEELDGAITVKGHQHYPAQDHTDPGINWDWPRYFTLITQGKIALPNQIPKALFTKQCTKMVCKFDASTSSDFEGEIVSYQWDFGDSKTTTGMKISHTYEKAGSYTVILTVVDSEQVSSNKTITVVIQAPVQIKTPQKESSGGGSIAWLLLASLLLKVKLLKVRKLD